MKSKAEMAYWLRHCASTTEAEECDGCPWDQRFVPDECRPAICIDIMLNDAADMLMQTVDKEQKSDLEVMKEVLGRSKEVRCRQYTAMSDGECLEIPFLRFDEEGNIL